MNEITKDEYLENGPFAHPGVYRPIMAAIVDDEGPEPRALAARLRSLMVHVFWQSAYGLKENRERAFAETNLRTVAQKLERVSAAQAALGRPALCADPLPPDYRLIGNCRDFSLMYAALLREAGIPARARCGFGMYFMPNHGEDHWITERWVASEGRWAISDSQLDEIMIERMKIAFDPMDLPDGAFLSGGEAWLACRRGDDPDKYGIFGLKGWDFVKGDFVRDLAALADLVLLPWDMWGVMRSPYTLLGDEDVAALDSAAETSPMRAWAGRAEAFAALADRRFALPRRIEAYLNGRLEAVDLGPVLGLDWPHGNGTGD
jgi:hypothetical protein